MLACRSGRRVEPHLRGPPLPVRRCGLTGIDAEQARRRRSGAGDVVNIRRSRAQEFSGDECPHIECERIVLSVVRGLLAAVGVAVDCENGDRGENAQDDDDDQNSINVKPASFFRGPRRCRSIASPLIRAADLIAELALR